PARVTAHRPAAPTSHSPDTRTTTPACRRRGSVGDDRTRSRRCRSLTVTGEGSLLLAVARRQPAEQRGTTKLAGFLCIGGNLRSRRHTGPVIDGRRVRRYFR